MTPEQIAVKLEDHEHEIGSLKHRMDAVDTVTKVALAITNGDYSRAASMSAQGIAPMFVINSTAKFDPETLTLKGGVARKVKKAYIGDENGVARLVYEV